MIFFFYRTWVAKIGVVVPVLNDGRSLIRFTLSFRDNCNKDEALMILNFLFRSSELCYLIGIILGLPVLFNFIIDDY